MWLTCHNNHQMEFKDESGPICMALYQTQTAQRLHPLFSGPGRQTQALLAEAEPACQRRLWSE